MVSYRYSHFLMLNLWNEIIWPNLNMTVCHRILLSLYSTFIIFECQEIDCRIALLAFFHARKTSWAVNMIVPRTDAVNRGDRTIKLTIPVLFKVPSVPYGRTQTEATNWITPCTSGCCRTCGQRAACTGVALGAFPIIGHDTHLQRDLI